MDNAYRQIAGIVEIAVSSVVRRSRAARAADRGDLVNEAWLVALESLPAARERATDLGPYLFTAIARSLRHALRRWGREPVADRLPDHADPAPRADDLLCAREAAARTFGALDEVDRAIAAALVGANGRRAADAREVARAFDVPIGRVYQARQNLARRAGLRGRPRSEQLNFAGMGGN
jgi:DNA-directed RNA polymerase specialized sigma24 family protein